MPHMHQSPRHLRTFLLLFLVTATAAGCARNPVTGQLQVALMTEAQEIQMGGTAAVEVERTIGLVDDPALQAYIQELGERMAQESERPALPWTFGVVDDPTPNAFALPGGYIYFTRGMMSLMSSEAQLATVLGHEIGHVTARHHVTRMSRAQLAQLGLGLGTVLFPELETLGAFAGAGFQLLFLQHSRSAERQADDLGFRYALEQGYDVREMANVFAALARLGEEQQSPLPSWLMTHPAPEDRITVIEERIAELEVSPATMRRGRPDYLARIDGLVYGTNPRNGFFRDALFLHPDLRFQLTFPSGWRTQNMAQAVIAGSPQQDAAMQLTLAGEATPEEAATRFFRQEGVRAGQSARRTINGLPALLVGFEARAGEVPVRGIAAFISYRERIYQILTYSAAPTFARYEPIFSRSIGSFAPLTDPEVLGVQPNRLRIVRVPEAMTLADFNRRFPSIIPIAELALINQVAGPEEVLPAGFQAKRVVGGS